MAEQKTQPTQVEVAAFISAAGTPARVDEAATLAALFRRVTGEEPRMWGPSIIGYGEYRTRYASGREVHGPRTAFSPRKAKHSLYLSCGSEDENAAFAPLLARLGKHSQAKACLYVNKLRDIDLAVLEEMVALSWRNSWVRHPD